MNGAEELRARLVDALRAARYWSTAWMPEREGAEGLADALLPLMVAYGRECAAAALEPFKALAGELEQIAATHNARAFDLRGQERPGAALGEQSAATAYDRSAAAVRGRILRARAAALKGSEEGT